MGKGKSFGVFSQKTIDDYTEREYNNDDYYMIPVGKEYSYNDKIVVITGSNQHPIIDRIVKVNGENEAVIGFCLQEVIDNAGQHDSLDYLGEVAGKRILEQHTSADFKTYGTLKKERERYNREGASYFNEDGKRGESPQEYIGFVKNAEKNSESIEDEFNTPDARKSKDDTIYLSAVERGDMETAQRMVDEAAEVFSKEAKKKKAL